jgi:hypothetical protein
MIARSLLSIAAIWEASLYSPQSPRVVAGEQLGRRAPNGLILIIDAGDCATKKMGKVVLHPTYLPRRSTFSPLSSPS